MLPTSLDSKSPPTFSSYQKLVVALLAFLQFTIILDFMILAPMGPIVMPQLGISARQFGLVVSAYAFSAGMAGLLAAGFADKFDRKRLLLTFYGGFLAGTFLCGIAPNYPFLLGARVVTGLFGGVIGSVSFAIVADLFPLQVRGRVMGTIQSAFAASQVMGIPIGLFLASHFGWHGPFRMIVAVGLLVGIVLVWKLKPITAHLEAARGRHPLRHLFNIATNRRYLVGFAATMLVATGGFMLQPFASNFVVHNLGVSLDHLPVIYMSGGILGSVRRASARAARRPHREIPPAHLRLACGNADGVVVDRARPRALVARDRGELRVVRHDRGTTGLDHGADLGRASAA
jgi:predicted MFS family arabinose efflux permease